MPKQKHNTQRITVRLPDSLYTDICRLATEYGYKNVSSFVRSLMEAIVEKECQAKGYNININLTNEPYTITG